MTRLPLALAPIEDESWPSYLTRRAAQHRTTLAQLGSHLGLRDSRGRWTGRFGVDLPVSDVGRVAPILGLSPEDVEAMQLASYDQLAFDLSGLREIHAIAATRAAAHAGWVWLAGSTFCPQCLAEGGGAWRLNWRVPWNTVCLRHQVKLLGACGTCGGVPGLGNQFHGSAPGRVVATPDGRLCQHALPGGSVCSADLSQQATATVSPGRLRRAELMTALTAGRRGRVAGVDRTSLQSLRAWQSAIGIAVSLGVVDTRGWGRTHRWANPPRDPELIDALLQAVEPLITASGPVAAADVLDGWMRNAGLRSPHANTFNRTTQSSAALRPAIDEVLSRHGRVHTMVQRLLVDSDGLPIDQRTWGVDDIPQLVWPCALPENLRRSTKPDQRILRAVVSMILVRMCTDAPDWVTAGAALGFPGDKSRNWTRYAFSAKWGMKGDLLIAARTLEVKLGTNRDRPSFHRRSQVSGFGSEALTDAQSPRCLERGGSIWCPCFPRPMAVRGRPHGQERRADVGRASSDG